MVCSSSYEPMTLQVCKKRLTMPSSDIAVKGDPPGRICLHQPSGNPVQGDRLRAFSVTRSRLTGFYVNLLSGIASLTSTITVASITSASSCFRHHADSLPILYPLSSLNTPWLRVGTIPTLKTRKIRHRIIK